MTGGEPMCAKVLRGLEKMTEQSYPGIWDELARIRAAKGKKTDWPDHVFVPISFCSDLVMYRERKRTGKRNVFEGFDSERKSISAMIFTLNAWRQTKGIYSFDRTLSEELSRTVIGGELPLAVMERSPEWCVCIDASFLREKIPEYGHCVGALLSVDEYRRPVCTLLLETDRGAGFAGVVIPENLQDFLSSLRGGEKESPNTRMVSWCLSSFLYMCSANADVDARGRKAPKGPKELGKKKLDRKTVAKGAAAPSYLDVGTRVGAALRRAFTYSTENGARFGDKNGTEAGVSKRPRPHTRTAHWHHYHVGPRNAEEKNLRLRWIHPVFVNLDRLGGREMPATVRRVDEESAREGGARAM